MSAQLSKSILTLLLLRVESDTSHHVKKGATNESALKLSMFVQSQLVQPESTVQRVVELKLFTEKIRTTA